MYWQEDEGQGEEYSVPDDIVDLSFQINCPELPLDHMQALSAALIDALPWLQNERFAGIHSIHGAESGNGWQRPSDPDTQKLHLSRRARMQLRLPKERVEAASTLAGRTMDIDGHALTVGKPGVKPLSTLPVQFARYVIANDEDDENSFLEEMANELHQLGIGVRKLLCGRSHSISTNDGKIFTRSLMVADLQPQESIWLQQQGIGEGRKLGCGLFMASKGIRAVKAQDGE